MVLQSECVAYIELYGVALNIPVLYGVGSALGYLSYAVQPNADQCGYLETPELSNAQLNRSLALGPQAALFLILGDSLKSWV